MKVQDKSKRSEDEEVLTEKVVTRTKQEKINTTVVVLHLSGHSAGLAIVVSPFFRGAGRYF